MSDYFTAQTEPQKPEKIKVPHRKIAVVGWALKNNAAIISVLLLIVTAFILFVATFDLTGTSVQEKILSATTLFVAGVAYILYFNGYTIGGEHTQNSQAVKDIYTKYGEKLKYLRENNLMNDLDAFIKEYVENELKVSRENILLCANLTPADYEKILAGEFRELTKAEKKAVKRAKELKPIKLSRQALLTATTENERRNPIASKTTIQIHKYMKFAFRFVSIVAKTIFVVSISVNLILNRNLETIIQSLLEIVFILASFTGGLSAGRKIKLEYAARTQDILNFFEEFAEWKKTK